MGVLNLLKVVNETRVCYCKAYEARQFFNIFLKIDVQCVWLDKGGRKIVESNKSSTDHPLNQAWNQSNINRIGQSFDFSNHRLSITQKIWVVFLNKISCKV